MSDRVALVVGATGLIGKALLALLIESKAHQKVVVLARRAGPPLPEKVEWRVVDFDQPSAYQDLAGIHEIYCCLGTTIKQAGSQEAFRKVDHQYPLALAQAARAAGVPKFLVVTAMGSDPGSAIFYNRVKGELERELSTLGFPNLVIARPSLLVGERDVARSGEGVANLAMGLVGPLMRGPLAKYRAIAGTTVAAALLRLANEAGPGNTIVFSDRLQALGAQS